MRPVLAVLLLLAVVAPVRADDAAMRTIYAAMENDVHSEYAALLDAVARGLTGGPAAQSGKTQEMLKIIYYNKAALFASCAADVEGNRADNPTRVPAERNIFLTTCVEEKFSTLNKFTNLLGYATAFFPGRIERCGEAARLPQREKLLPPYGFFALAEPKLYDFARYNDCLMTPE